MALVSCEKGARFWTSGCEPAKFDMKFWQISSKYKMFFILCLNLTLLVNQNKFSNYAKFSINEVFVLLSNQIK